MNDIAINKKAKTENRQGQSAREKAIAARKARAKKAAILRYGRIVVQILFFIFAPALFSQAFGGIKEIFTSMGSGTVIEVSVFVTKLIMLCLLTILCGRIFCGWACAFGALGDWIFEIVQLILKKLKIKPFKIPLKIVPYLQKVKYIILILLLVLCFAQQNAMITQYSPWTPFSLWTAGNFKVAGLGGAIVLLLLIFIGMGIHERFFCQFLCPMGAVFSLLPEIPFLALKRKKEECIPNCQACRMQCPVKIKLDESPTADGECIRCGRCTTVCPKKNIGFRE
ncbi:MAG: 4Fe-4S binding protein [Eubacterium sp.]